MDTATLPTWCMIAADATHHREQLLEHVVAELHAVGRWLAVSRVFVANHDLAVDRLFRDATEVAQ